MFEEAKAAAASWIKEPQIEMRSAVSTVTFSVITKILFGRDNALDRKLLYCAPDGSTQRLSIYKMFGIATREAMGAASKPINLLFPILARLNVDGENRRITKNLNTLKEALGQFVKESMDNESVGKQLFSSYASEQ